MLTIILVVYCFIVVALVGVVLMQRSEGGALGIGGGGPGGGFMSGRGAANALTRTTSVLAALYMGTCLVLAVFADNSDPNADLSRELLGEDGLGTQVTPGEVSGDDLLRGFEFDDAPPAAVEDAGEEPQASDATPQEAVSPAEAPFEEPAAQDDAAGDEGETPQR